MTHEWVLDVLADLKAFAIRNGLRALAEHLDDAKMIAATEIASIQGRRPGSGADDGIARSDRRTFAAGDNA